MQGIHNKKNTGEMGIDFSFTNKPSLRLKSFSTLLVLTTSLLMAQGQPVKQSRALTSSAINGPLKIHPANHRYFTDNTGKAIYLTGSHTWASLQDQGETLPLQPFNFNQYLDFLTRYHHNFIRLWVWENARWEPWATDYYNDPLPYLRTGMEKALDGRPKFDLNQFNDTFFQRLRERVVAAGKKGIYVSVMLFQGWSIEKKVGLPGNPWLGHPFNKANNVNGIDGDLNNDDIGPEVHTLLIKKVTDYQEAYVRKVLQTLNDLDNVLYEITNETGKFSTEWQFHMIRFIKAQEAGMPKQHMVGMTFQCCDGATNDILFSSPADWISPNEQFGAYKDNPPAANGSKIILLDTDHLWGEGGNDIWVWKTFLRGMHPIFMDDLKDQDWQVSARKAMGQTLRYAEKMELASMRPIDSLSSTRYCLANPGREYLVYQAYSAPFTVQLVPGNYVAEWFNPNTGAVKKSMVAAGVTKQIFTAPFERMAVLYLKRQ
jgi:hypothetical protein